MRLWHHEPSGTGDRHGERIYRTAEAVPEQPVAVVFGAGYWPDGTPSDVMKNRCTGQTAFLALAQAFGSR